MLALALRALPYLIALAVGAWGAHQYDGTRYSALQGAFSKYQSQVAQAELASQTAYSAALAAQLKAKDDAETHNAQVIHDLEDRTVKATAQHSADSAYIRRLLSNAKTPTPSGSGEVSAAHPLPGAPEASGESGPEAVADLCADTKAEDERNANRLDALIAEIKPQL